MEIGTIYEATCKNMEEFGLFVEVEHDGQTKEGLIIPANIQYFFRRYRREKKIPKELTPGKKIQVVLINTDPENKYNDFRLIGCGDKIKSQPASCEAANGCAPEHGQRSKTGKKTSVSTRRGKSGANDKIE